VSKSEDEIRHGMIIGTRIFNENPNIRLFNRQVVYLQRAGKYKRPAWQASQEQKGLGEKPLRASQGRFHPW
jgi:hypothetical protein